MAQLNLTQIEMSSDQSGAFQMAGSESPPPLFKAEVERSSNIEKEMEELKRMRDAELLRSQGSSISAF